MVYDDVPRGVANHLPHLDEEAIHADAGVLLVPREKSVLNKTNHNLLKVGCFKTTNNQVCG